MSRRQEDRRGLHADRDEVWVPRDPGAKTQLQSRISQLLLKILVPTQRTSSRALRTMNLVYRVRHIVVVSNAGSLSMRLHLQLVAVAGRRDEGLKAYRDFASTFASRWEQS